MIHVKIWYFLKEKNIELTLVAYSFNQFQYSENIKKGREFMVRN